MHKLAPALSVNIFNFVHKNYRIYLINFKTLWCTVFNIGLFCCMCCIIFKNWTKLGPLLQVAKLSVYNLSNKQVFYSGMVCVVFASGDCEQTSEKQCLQVCAIYTILKEQHHSFVMNFFCLFTWHVCRSSETFFNSVHHRQFCTGVLTGFLGSRHSLITGEFLDLQIPSSHCLPSFLSMSTWEGIVWWTRFRWSRINLSVQLIVGFSLS